MHFSQLQILVYLFICNFIQGNTVTCSTKKYFNFTWLNLETASHLNLAPSGTGWLSAGCKSGAGNGTQPLQCCCCLLGVAALDGSGGSGSCREGQGSSQDSRTSITFRSSAMVSQSPP